LSISRSGATIAAARTGGQFSVFNPEALGGLCEITRQGRRVREESGDEKASLEVSDQVVRVRLTRLDISIRVTHAESRIALATALPVERRCSARP